MRNSLDDSDTRKQQIATRLVDDAFRTKNGVISTQVFKEFFVTVTQKISWKQNPLEAEEIMKRFALNGLFNNLGISSQSAFRR